MTNQRPLESENQSSPETIPEAADDWFHQFKKVFEWNFIDVAGKLPADADHLALLRSTLQAVFRTMEDSGLSPEEAFALAVEVASPSSAEPVTWTPELNARRFELIDKQIANRIMLEERVELSRLTQAMRHALDTEANLPMEAARQLHGRLQQLRTRQQELRHHPR